MSEDTVIIEPEAVKIPLIYERLADVLEHMPAVAKDMTNKALGNSKYRSIDAIVGAIHPLFKKNKLIFNPEVLDSNTTILDRTDKQTGVVVGKTVHVSMKIMYHIVCLDDMSEVTIGPLMTEGIDMGDKATFKAYSMGEKYLFSQLFTIPCQNAFDGDADNPDLPPTNKAKSLVAAKTGNIPPMTVKEVAIIQSVAEKLFDSCPDNFHIDNQKIAAACYAYRGAYPDDPTKIGTIAAWLGKDINAVCTKNTRT